MKEQTNKIINKNFKKVEKKSSIVIVIAEAAIASHNTLFIAIFLYTVYLS